MFYENVDIHCYGLYKIVTHREAEGNMDYIRTSKKHFLCGIKVRETSELRETGITDHIKKMWSGTHG
ncbi:hypothetical protein [Virgibacillus sp. CBA3643]|uniref:hypothetical protein n=1 Tax=Virgibacillus sp. CBA3643 TaxID=2942278 RepID=UPI0035A304EE